MEKCEGAGQPNTPWIGAQPVSVSEDCEPLRMESQFSSQQQFTVVTLPPSGPPIRDFLPWSIFSLVNMNACCLGLLAVIYSVKARDRKMVGDMNGARSYGHTARTYNIVATTIGVLCVVVFIVVLIVGVKQIDFERWYKASPKYSDENTNWFLKDGKI